MRCVRRPVVVVVLAVASAMAAPAAAAAPSVPEGAEGVGRRSALPGAGQKDPVSEICKVLPLPLLCPKK